MESSPLLKTENRHIALTIWLSQVCHLGDFTLTALPHHASLRRYFRIHTDKTSFIAMDAPPPQENCMSFIAISHALRNIGLETPEIIAKDLSHGFLLLSDFGDTTYLKALNSQNADLLYHRALHDLAILQRCQQISPMTIPAFKPEFMWQEWKWHKEWFLQKLLRLTFDHEEALDTCYNLLIESAASQPQVFMHRDYHADNLMVLPEGKMGILDFQDAFIGPITYDAVSLLRDCYIDWPAEKVTAWALHFWQRLKNENNLNLDATTFLRYFDLMGLQRHLKALFTFSRKIIRDQDLRYYHAIPRTLHYIETVSQNYPELAALYDYWHTIVVPAFTERKQTCAP